MCVVSKSTSSSSPFTVESNSNKQDMSSLSEDSFSSLLEFAANNDYEAFKTSVEQDSVTIDEVGLWYVRKKSSKQIVLEQRTPLMVAATYGSLDVVKFIISQPAVDVNRACGLDKCTALHCAASGGAVNAVDIVKLLLAVGADPNIKDSYDQRAVDVIFAHPIVRGVKAILEDMLLANVSDGSTGEFKLQVSIASSNYSPSLSSSPDNASPCSPLELLSSPMMSKFNDVTTGIASEKKEYPIDPSLPDIKNSIYSTDEFRMFSFKVKPCSRGYSHDWTECPFVHPGENARRRDPRKFHYSCVPCPDFRKGSCRRGDMCEYAHGVFECWLHPAQYRTRLCKDGTSCARRVCFFAHIPDELRPLYVSTGSAVPSPRSNTSAASAMDMAVALSLLPGSPSSTSVMSPGFNQPMSPSGNGAHSSVAWAQPSIPALHLPGSNMQSSRLRSSLNARDIPPEDFQLLQDMDVHQLLLNDLACLSQSRPSPLSLNRSGRPKALTPSNLEELFSAELASSPRYSDQAASTSAFSPSHRSAVLNQFQQQQNMLSPINNNVFSPKNADHPLSQASYSVSSPGRMSPRNVEPISPMGSQLTAFAQREFQQQKQMQSLSSRDLGSHNVSIVGSPVNSWSKWSSPSGKVDWSVNGGEHSWLQKSSSFDHEKNRDEPDLSWVQSLVKESPPEMKDKLSAPVASAAPSGEGSISNSHVEPVDRTVLGDWLEQMQLDQLVV